MGGLRGDWRVGGEVGYFLLSLLAQGHASSGVPTAHQAGSPLLQPLQVASNPWALLAPLLPSVPPA